MAEPGTGSAHAMEPSLADKLCFACSRPNNEGLGRACRLIAAGASIEQPAMHGLTPLQSAAHTGNKLICAMLLKLGAPLDARGEYGASALHIACAARFPAVAQVLLAHGADANAAAGAGTTSITQGATPLHVACQMADVQTATLLLANGARVDQRNDSGDTPLYVATCAGHRDVVELLLRNGADANAANAAGFTPLTSACVERDLGIAELLLANGGAPDHAGTDKYTLLMAACHASDFALAQLLLSHGAHIDRANVLGTSALLLACLEGNAPAVQFLLANGACAGGPLQAPAPAITPLHAASAGGHVELVRLLLQHGAAVSPAAPDGNTPLAVAAERRHAEVVRLLLQHGAQLSAACSATDLQKLADVVQTLGSASTASSSAAATPTPEAALLPAAAPFNGTSGTTPQSLMPLSTTITAPTLASASPTGLCPESITPIGSSATAADHAALPANPAANPASASAPADADTASPFSENNAATGGTPAIALDDAPSASPACIANSPAPATNPAPEGPSPAASDNAPTSIRTSLAMSLSAASASAPIDAAAAGLSPESIRPTHPTPPKQCAQCGALKGPGVRLSKCSGCQAVRYCSAACQKLHWREGGHKWECKLLRC